MRPLQPGERVRMVADPSQVAEVCHRALWAEDWRVLHWEDDTMSEIRATERETTGGIAIEPVDGERVCTCCGGRGWV